MTDKSLQYKILDDNEVPLPSWQILSSETQSVSFLSNYKKCIVKPADRSASAGVSLVTSRNELMNAISWAKSESLTKKVLIEEFIDGPEFSVETISLNGEQHVLAITRKLLGSQPGFVELGHSLPATISSEHNQQIVEIAKKATKALGLEFGVCHVVNCSPLVGLRNQFLTSGEYFFESTKFFE
ncbi:acetyl-CoA carboxylase biotin carboxylase subunit family protein [Rothia sp. ND6WE1A]|uniref:ATP-grasp domain-containing protein n=1 Tax=Rothia sp. ND6WE1A TaxID=1848190 RepID=UPI0013015E99|nr:ATP-grasp domain-containing protein [Rothia sp. ND6WE1A]